MSNIKVIEAPEGQTKDLYSNIQKQMGMVPNIFKTLAHSPAALESYLNQSNALAKGQLSAQLREQIAITIANLNQCDYCSSAHTLLAKKVGLSETEIEKNTSGQSDDAKTQAGLSFARTIVINHGKLDTTDLSIVRQAGFTEGEIVEIIAHVGINIFTNYFNHIADTEIDFPLVKTVAAKS